MFKLSLPLENFYPVILVPVSDLCCFEILYVPKIRYIVNRLCTVGSNVQRSNSP